MALESKNCSVLNSSLSIESLASSFLNLLKNFKWLKNNGRQQMQLSVKKHSDHYLSSRDVKLMLKHLSYISTRVSGWHLVSKRLRLMNVLVCRQEAFHFD